MPNPPKFKTQLAKDWLVIITIVVVGFTATYFFVRNPGSVVEMAGQVTGAIGSVVYLADDFGREKQAGTFKPQAGGGVGSAGSTGESASEAFDPGELFAAKVVDGETIRLSDGEVVKLLGVKAGETAGAFIQREIVGKNIVLSAQMKDGSGRTLAYVHRRGDNFFLNVEMIKQGFGLTDVSTPFEKMEEFNAYEQQARTDKRGLWGEPEIE